jgi:hypothetical protein
MTIHENQILAYVGGAALERYGCLTRRIALPQWRGEDFIETFVRDSGGTGIGADERVHGVAVDVPRLRWIGGHPHLILEGARAQVADNPQAPNSWSDVGTPSVTPGVTDPWGGADAILVDGSAGEGRLTDATVTGDGTKVWILALAPDTGTTVVVRISDSTAGVERHSFTVTWNGGTTPPTLAPTAGAGTFYPPVPIYAADGRLWWMVRASAEGIIAANDNNIRALVSDGTFYLAGANAFDAPFPSSWQGPTLANRVADLLTITRAIPLSYDLSFHVVVGDLDMLRVGAVAFRIRSAIAIGDSAGAGGPALSVGWDHQTTPPASAGIAIWAPGGSIPICGVSATATVFDGPVAITGQYRGVDGAVRLHYEGAWSAWTPPATGPWPLVGTFAPTISIGTGYFEPSTPDSQLYAPLRVAIIARGHHEPGAFAEWIP